MTHNYNFFKLTIIIFLVLFISLLTTSQTITDIDGNIYNTVIIGNQTWLQQDLRALHYSNGSDITEVWSYNDNDSLANIYGKLYTWDAAMNYSNSEKAQGACPNGWHIPSDEEWSILGEFLGGNLVAGGKLKESDTIQWDNPNTAATNESGFNALPAGEYDDTHYQFLGQYNVIWSSTEASTQYAKYRYLSYESQALSTYTYYKDFRYSVRCIKNTEVGINKKGKKEFKIFPNPVDMVLNINKTDNKPKTATLINQHGKEIKNFCVCNKINYEDMYSVKSGIYILKIEDEQTSTYFKIIKK